MKIKGTSASEIIFGIVMMGCLLIPIGDIQNLGIILGIYDIRYYFWAIRMDQKVKTGKTVSQQFWAFSKEYVVKAWVVLSSMLIAWLALLWHLASKMLSKKKKEQ